jgi:hypothetical protein
MSEERKLLVVKQLGEREFELASLPRPGMDPFLLSQRQQERSVETNNKD